jgi:hypothetical protein
MGAVFTGWGIGRDEGQYLGAQVKVPHDASWPRREKFLHAEGQQACAAGVRPALGQKDLQRLNDDHGQPRQRRMAGRKNWRELLLQSRSQAALTSSGSVLWSR